MDATIAVAKREDLINLLGHIAWTDILYPRLTRHKQALMDLLVRATLEGGNIQTNTGATLTKEMIAGRIEGIAWVTKLIESVLKEGERALSVL